MSASIVFPYKKFKNFPCPIIKVSLRSQDGWIDTEAYVDSGASISLFSVVDAQRLKIDYTTGKRIYSMVGDGNLIPVFLHKVSAKIGNLAFTATIGFSLSLGVGFNLMGRRDFFSAFNITFSDSAKTITFIPRR